MAHAERKAKMTMFLQATSWLVGRARWLVDGVRYGLGLRQDLRPRQRLRTPLVALCDGHGRSTASSPYCSTTRQILCMSGRSADRQRVLQSRPADHIAQESSVIGCCQERVGAVKAFSGTGSSSAPQPVTIINLKQSQAAFIMWRAHRRTAEYPRGRSASLPYRIRLSHRPRQHRRRAGEAR